MVASDWLRRGEIDAFATNKGILYEMADRVPGSRVLEGRWGLEQLAVAVPQGRGVAAPWLRAFVADVAAQGLVQQAAARAGLRGGVPAQR
jgi:polar amino acid transport system substrate-binding protein